MKNWLLFLTFTFFTTHISTAQLNPISEDSLVNRMSLNSLNSSVKAGQASAVEYFNRGNLNLFFSDTSKALSDYSIAVSKNKELDLAYLSRGVIYQKLKKNELAEADFTAAIKLGKFPSIALNNRGFLYQNWDRINEAIKDFERSIKADPTHTLPYINLVDIYLNQQMDAEAFEILNRLVAANPVDPKAYTTRSDVYRDAGMMRKAYQDLNKAVEVSGIDPDFLIERAKFKDDYIFDDLGAVEDCDLAIQKNPEKADYYYQRSRPLYDLAEYERVIRDCNKAIEIDPNHTNAMIMLANVMDMFNQLDDARKLYQQAIEGNPDDYDGYKQLSVLEFSQGNKEVAISILESFMDRGNFHPDILEQHGKITADLKQYSISIGDFTELIDHYPNDSKYYFLRGIVQDSIGNHEAACSDMVRADNLGLNQAHQYLRKHCKSKLNAKTLQLEDMLDEALNLEMNGQTQEAIVTYTNLIKIAPDSSVFYYNRGKAKRRLENHEGAIEDYLKAIEIDNDRVVYIVSLAVSYSYLDKIDEAIKEYKKAIKIEPSYAMSYYNLGGIYAERKKYDDAIELLETSLYYSPNYTKAMMGLADCYLDLNDMNKACEWFTKAEEAGETKAFGKRIRSCR